MPDEQTMAAHIEDLPQERSHLYAQIRRLREEMSEIQTEAQMLEAVQADKDRLINKLRAQLAVYDRQQFGESPSPFRYKDASNNGN